LKTANYVIMMLNYVIITYKLCNHYVTIVGTCVHQCKIPQVRWRTSTTTLPASHEYVGLLIGASSSNAKHPA